ncbi:MAG: sigma factor-like helix-turn-helix DNA-binding protein [Patescibacteria group bacterium]
MVKNIDHFINNLLAGFNSNQVRVINERFGLKTSKRATLQKIGDELGVTRERVRQIEEQCTYKLSKKIKAEAHDFVSIANAHLVSMGGVSEDSSYIESLKNNIKTDLKNVKNADVKLRFIFLTAGTPNYSKENDDTKAYWYADEDSNKKFLDSVKKTTKFLESNNKYEIISQKTVLAEYKNPVMQKMLFIPKHLGTNVFGDFGLRSWPEIEPKTIRDKAYLVLHKHGKPLHFEEIAKSITRFGIDKKQANIQTVHNELIKDERFVLVGRGMYALQEHGFSSGTVREVIGRLLKGNGPLASYEVVKLVSAERILKENTILLSLQNRRHFKRLGDGRYSTKEA